MQNSILVYHKNKLIFVFLFFLVIVGLYFRLQKLPSYWDTDFARLYLVPYHIVKFHEFPIVGQFAMGSGFYYTPFMEYFLAIIMLISTNLKFVIGFIAVIHSLSIITVYYIGNELYRNRSSGLIAAVLFTFSTSEIYYSRSLLGYGLVIPFALLSLYLFLKYIRTDSPFSFIFSYIFLFVGTLLNYPLILFVPVYAYVIYRRKKKLIPELILTSAIIISIISLHLPMLSYPHDFNLIGEKIYKLDEIPRYLSLYLDAVFFITQKKTVGPIVFLLLLIFNLSIDKSIIKKNAILITLFILTSIAVVFINNHLCCSNLCCLSYYIPVYPHFYIFSAFLIVNLISKKYLIAKTISIILAPFLILSVTSDKNSMYQFHDEYIMNEKAADNIMTDALINGFRDFNAIIVSPDSSDWHNPTLWYFFEVKTGKKFVRMVNNKFKFEMENNPEVLYVYWLNENKVITEDYFKTLTLYNVDSKIYKEKDYTIYRLFKKMSTYI